MKGALAKECRQSLKTQVLQKLEEARISLRAPENNENQQYLDFSSMKPIMDSDLIVQHSKFELS